MKNSIKNIVLTKSGNVNKSINNTLKHCSVNEKEGKIYTGYYNGSGKWATKGSAQPTVVEILKAGNFKYEIGNDSPKGGITGDFVKVSKTAMKAFLEAKNIQ